MPMRSGREEGFGHVYDAKGKPMLFQEEYVVKQNKCFVSSDCPEAPLGLMEGEVYLTNWRILALGPLKQVIVTDTLASGTYHAARIRHDLSKPACDFLEVYLDEIRDMKKTLLGDLKLFVPRGCIDVGGSSKEFRAELMKAVEWYLRSRR